MSRSATVKQSESLEGHLILYQTIAQILAQESYSPAAVCRDNSTQSHNTAAVPHPIKSIWETTSEGVGGWMRLPLLLVVQGDNLNSTPQEVLRQRVTSCQPCLHVQRANRGGGAVGPGEALRWINRHSSQFESPPEKWISIMREW